MIFFGMTQKSGAFSFWPHFHSSCNLMLIVKHAQQRNEL